jgi:hypothetical protein
MIALIALIATAWSGKSRGQPLPGFFRGHRAASLIAPTWLLTAAHAVHNILGEVHLASRPEMKDKQIDRQ